MRCTLGNYDFTAVFATLIWTEISNSPRSIIEGIDFRENYNLGVWLHQKGLEYGIYGINLKKLNQTHLKRILN